MPLKPIFQLILLIVCIAAFGWMGLIWFFVAYFVIGFIPVLIAKPWKKQN